MMQSERALQALTSQQRAIEVDFPIIPLSHLAEKESWRKELGRPLYHIHKWWATRLGTVFRAIGIGTLADKNTDIWSAFYCKHNFAGKVVLDPFMGSGTTLGEALKLGCSVIGCDINPISSFLVRQALTPISEQRLRTAFASVAEDVREDIQRYYSTADRQTGMPIQVLYNFWVKVLTTPDGEDIPLFSSYVFSRDAYPKKKPRAQIVCSSCWCVFEDRYDVTSVACPLCHTAFNPQLGPASGQFVTSRSGARYRVKALLPADGPPRERLYALMAVRADGKKVYLAPSSADHALFADASSRLRRETLPLPTMPIRTGHNTDQARGYNYLQWSDCFNDRQLLCLGLLLRSIMRLEDREAQEQLLCLFSSVLEFNNRFCSFKGEGTGAVRHMFSHHILKPERHPLENSIWGGPRTSGTFASLFESRLLPAKRYLDQPYEVGESDDVFGDYTASGKPIASNPLRPKLVEAVDRKAGQSALILNGNSAQLPVPDDYVDAIITDPPYFDFIHYSELSDFFFAWLSPVLRDRYAYFAQDDSSAVGEVQSKDVKAFARLLGNVFTECERVLKDDGLLVFSFHHSRAEGWAAIYEALTTSGFSVVASHPIHAELRGASPKNGTREPISLDAILICRKSGSTVRRLVSDIDILKSTACAAAALRAGGLEISRTDEFVVSAGQLLSGSGHDAKVADIEARLERLRLKLVPAQDAS